MKAHNNIFKIVITGPECSGKTTLAADLSAALSEPLVAEYAREYLSKLGRPYAKGDLLPILKGQLAEIEKAILAAKKFVVIDTGPEVIQIWHRDKFGPETKEIQSLAANFKADLYLLCSPNIPFEADSLREDEHRREELFGKYQSLLQYVKMQIIAGSKEQRLSTAMKAINIVLNQYNDVSG